MESILPTRQDLEQFLHLKYGDLRTTGWGPRLRSRFGYHTPDDIYEATVEKLVGAHSAWLDVGGGRDLFPGNEALATNLSQSVRLLVGVDPSHNILQNRFVHQRVKSTVERFQSATQFDLVTLRMVTEHLTDPAAAVAAISRLSAPAGVLVIYTVNRWSAITAISKWTPLRVHRRAKKWLWRTEERDTFPVSYRMNTRKELGRILAKSGFIERDFAYLGDCRILARWKFWNTIELSLWKTLQILGLPQLETCLLGVYQKSGGAEKSSLAEREGPHASGVGLK